MALLWICQSLSCDYQEVAALARYCAWCGQDMMALCLNCQEPIDQKSGWCTGCSLSSAVDEYLRQSGGQILSKRSYRALGGHLEF